MALGKVMVKCPATGRELSTGVEMDTITFQGLTAGSFQIKCPICGIDHTWSMRDAWLEELLQATATRCGSSALEKALKTRLSEMREETNDAWRKMDAERRTNSNETAHDS